LQRSTVVNNDGIEGKIKSPAVYTPYIRSKWLAANLPPGTPSRKAAREGMPRWILLGFPEQRIAREIEPFARILYERDLQSAANNG
jgi:hypothetical protein